MFPTEPELGHFHNNIKGKGRSNEEGGRRMRGGGDVGWG